MSNIEENAFQIARYMLENPQEDGQVAIRDSLRLSDEDFRLALKFLVPDYCNTYGQFGGKDAGIRSKNLAKLQEFVNRISEKRVPLSRDAERLLKLLFVNQSDFPFSLGNHIMTEFNWTENQYIQVSQELSDKGLVRGEYADGNTFFKISIIPEGREAVRNNFRSPNLLRNSVQFIGNNNIINISSTLTSISQSIQINSNIDSSARQEIAALLDQLNNALKDIPVENIDDGEAVAELAKNFVENATKEKPNKKMVEISADSLKKAANNLAAVLPAVLLIAEKLISFILALHR